MNPQSDIVTWAMILLLVVGSFLLFLAFLNWWRNRRSRDPSPVRLSEKLRGRS